MPVARPARRDDAQLVLIGFAESLAAIETAWLLLDAGYAVAAFTRRGRRPAIGRDSRLTVYPLTSPQDDAHAAIADLTALARRLAPHAVLPLDDDAVWLCDVASSSDEFPVVAGPTGPQARLALDKRRQIELATASGLAVPATVVLDPLLDADRFVPETDGPWIVKPAMAAVEIGGRLTRGRSVIAAAESEVRAFVQDNDQPMLVQPRVRGVGEGLFGQVTRDGGVRAWSAHQRVRMMNPAGSGSSACRAIDPDEALRKGAEAFLHDGGWRGLFMLEFLRDDSGTAWFMELNGRSWGSMALSRHRGLPYPVWTVQDATGRSDTAVRPAVPETSTQIVVRHLGRELVHLAFVARGPRDGTPRGDWPKLAPTLRAMMRYRRDERLYNLRRGQWRVLLADTWQTLAAVRRGRQQRAGQ